MENSIHKSFIAFFEELVTTRQWNASHGGVYVPITKTTKPNPYLNIRNRDIITTDSLRFTKVNPAFMTRQISEIAYQNNKISYHITSLKPIRPSNKADKWETKALELFEQGQEEVFDYVDDDTISHYKYMAPLQVNKACMKCHAKQGYKVGDIRGGISITTLSTPYIEEIHSQIIDHSIIHFLILCVGLMGIIWSRNYSVKQYKVIEEQAHELAKSQNVLKSRAVELEKINKDLQISELNLKESNVTKDKFFTIISHDLINPIGSFRDLTKIMSLNLENFTREDIVDSIGSMFNSSAYLYDLLENLLQWAQTQTGAMQHYPTKIYLNVLIDDNLNVFKQKADEKNIQIVNKLESKFAVYADGNMTNAIIRNLFSNALKFSHQTGVITISAKQIGDFVEFSVKDQGVGIKPEELKKLFKINDHHSTLGTSYEKGTGLGLILCREFVEKNKGAINVESKPGNGSCFTVSLPVFKA